MLDAGRPRASRSICYQGAVVADADGRWLRHVPIELELAQEAIAAVEAEGYEPNVYVDDELYVARVTPEAEAYASFQQLAIHAVGDLGSWLDRDADEARLRRRPRRARRARRRGMRERFGGRLYVTKSLPYFLEFATLGRHEGLGPRLPRRAHSASRREQTIAFGDGENDVELSSGRATASRSRTRTSA